ncbi:sugar phosphate nucleotidyltransferase [Chloroflexota bacterium]
MKGSLRNCVWVSKYNGLSASPYPVDVMRGNVACKPEWYNQRLRIGRHISIRVAPAAKFGYNSHRKNYTGILVQPLKHVNMDRVLTIILAGGAGERLQPLTRVRSKPAIPFAGKFRLIDFPLSNCINSDLRQIFVLIQYRSWLLQKHIQEGWGISSSGLGEYIYCVPAQQKIGEDWYRGTADAIRQNSDLLRGKSFEQGFDIWDYLHGL